MVLVVAGLIGIQDHHVPLPAAFALAAAAAVAGWEALVEKRPSIRVTTLPSPTALLAFSNTRYPILPKLLPAAAGVRLP